ncbi:MAG: ferrous iron transport protein B, partial [Legionellales bacterium RIFCSPHIGHO2_12_FULL_35_11]
NLLTGDNQRVGNWAGVTVEKKSGSCFDSLNQEIEIIDLPGVYSLCIDESKAEDCKITARELVDDSVDLIINIIDASNLERNLYLTTQLLELKKPMIIVMNMMDVANYRKISIDTELLAKKLDCTVVSMQAHKSIGINELKKAITKSSKNISKFYISFPDDLKRKITNITKKISEESSAHIDLATFHAYRFLEGGRNIKFSLCSDESTNNSCNINHQDAVPEDTDIIMADKRYCAIHSLVLSVQSKKSDFKENLSAKIDKLILNRFLALPLFLGIMYCIFLIALNVGSAFQDFFSILTNAIFVEGAAEALNSIHTPNWLVVLLANGIGRGINTTATFIPVIAMMFFCLSILELSGYMARAAFIIDRIMRILGLPGKSFVPMIVGFGCNVPGIMAARTLDSERDRVLTVLMSPFMSCSARLAIYAVFVAAFFPSGGQNIVFSLYIIGILMAVFTGFLLRKTFLHGQESPLIIELPAYHVPSFKRLTKETMFRLRHFLIRAGKLIIPICVLLSGLDSLIIHTFTGEMSVIEAFGKWITPIFSPMGISQDNWPAVVGLLTGTLAKEVVIGCLNSLYVKIGYVTDTEMLKQFSFVTEFKEAFTVLFAKLGGIKEAILNPFQIKPALTGVNQAIYGVMQEHFHSLAAAYSYLLFVLLYIPCASTMAAIRQETTSKLMWFSILWSLVIAYVTAVVFYQAAGILHNYQFIFSWFKWIILLIILGTGIKKSLIVTKKFVLG